MVKVLRLMPTCALGVIVWLTYGQLVIANPSVLDQGSSVRRPFLKTNLHTLWRDQSYSWQQSIHIPLNLLQEWRNSLGVSILEPAPTTIYRVTWQPLYPTDQDRYTTTQQAWYMEEHFVQEKASLLFPEALKWVGHPGRVGVSKGKTPLIYGFNPLVQGGRCAV
jgi:hypothetical protein